MDMMRISDASLPARERFAAACLSRVGMPYRWGAQDGDRFDCSGLIVWAMGEIGKPFPHDVSSAGLYDLYHAQKCMPAVAPVGSLFLYSGNNDGRVTHVMVVGRIWEGGQRILVGARGGNSVTTSDKVAYAKGAMVDVVTAEYWKSNLLFAVDPFMGT